MRVTRWIWGLVLLVGACAPPGPDVDPGEHQTYLVFDYDAVSQEYRLHPEEIRTLTDPRTVAGEVAFVRGGGRLVSADPTPDTEAEFERALVVEGDLAPSAEYTIEDGVVVPFDFDTQMMVTLYHHMERASDYFASLDFDTDRVGRLPIYYYPQLSVLGVALPLFNDNAAYAFTLDAFLIPPRLVLQEDVPLSANRGVIVHEYSHAVFNRIVYEDDRSPPPVFPGYASAVHNELKSLDEGLADLFAALALGQPNFIESSISSELFEIDRDLSRERVWDEELQTRVDDANQGGGNPYILGSVIASTLWATRSIFDDETLGRLALDAMHQTRNPSEGFSIAFFFNVFMDAAPSADRPALCNLFEARLQLIENSLDC